MRGAGAPRPPTWAAEERAALAPLVSPTAIQAFLDSIPYSADPFYRCPRRVLADLKAHCFDGAVFAAACLRRLDHEPLLLDMGAVRDDDHVIALFRRAGRWGAVAKSNVTGLRFREPIHRTLRELVMTYFEAYFNEEGEKTLRSYSIPVRLAPLDGLDWEQRDAAMERIAERLDHVRHVRVLTPAEERALSPLDRRSYEAGMLGLDRAGLYRGGKV